MAFDLTNSNQNKSVNVNFKLAGPIFNADVGWDNFFNIVNCKIWTFDIGDGDVANVGNAVDKSDFFEGSVNSTIDIFALKTNVNSMSCILRRWKNHGTCCVVPLQRQDSIIAAVLKRDFQTLQIKIRCLQNIIALFFFKIMDRPFKYFQRHWKILVFDKSNLPSKEVHVKPKG